MVFTGLHDSEIQESLIKNGSNLVRIKTESLFSIIARQFKNPMIYLLLASALISFILKNYPESIAICVIVLINSLVGFFQEFRSSSLISRISKFISSKVEVIRSSMRQQIDKSELVVGDIILIKLGDIVPADCILLKGDNIQVDESILTGESETVRKTALVLLKDEDNERHNLYAGSFISTGSGVARVVKVGNATKFGMISHLAINTKKPSEFQKNSEKLSRGFSIVGLLFLVLILGLQLFLKPDGLSRWPELALFTITLMVSLIPEALPIISNLSIAQKAHSLGKKGLIVRHLTALEDLGNIDILCTDKTGTLTENKQKVVSSAVDKEASYKYIWSLSIDSSDDIDVATRHWLVEKQNFDKKILAVDDYTEIPFDPATRLSGRVFKNKVIYKGSPEAILDLCDVYKNKKITLLKTIQDKSKHGLRTISYAVKQLDTNKIDYLGSVFLADEIKSDADDIVRACETNNIQLKILTGDSFEVAVYIAMKAGLIASEDECVDVSTLPYHDLDLLEHILHTKKVFARTKPEDKYKIIAMLQKSHVVGYLGDGINDAPALALAQVGIVVDTASDIAKSTADIILIKPELNTIILGIREGRAVFENIQKYLRFTLIGNFGNAFTIGLISLILPFEPILAIQVLIVNLLTDIPMLAISGDSVDTVDLKSPRKQELHKLLFYCILLGLVSTVFDFIFIAINRNFSPGYIQTSWFFFSICTELILIFSIRSKKFIFKSKQPKSILLELVFLAFLIGFWLSITGFRFLGITILPISSLIYIFGLAIIYIAVSETAKHIFYKYLEPNISYD
jgi:P-type Mg2+ transporter